jgi:hypothetical protein
MKKRAAKRQPVRVIDQLEAQLKDLEHKQNVLEGYAEMIHDLLEELKARIEDRG